MDDRTQRFESLIARVRGLVKDPRAGLYGPGSVSWKVFRNQVLGIGGPRALLLQTAHPLIAHAVAEHSRFREDPLGRGDRTFRAVNAMVFGDLEMAIRAARRVHAVHRRVRGRLARDVGPFPAGTPYDADRPELVLWVYATLWETSLLVHEAIVGPLPDDEKERFYEEGRLFAYLFGLDDETMPPTLDAFLAYNERMWASEELAVDPVSLEIARFLLAPPRAGMGPLMAWVRAVTAALMPPTIRARYGFPLGRRELLVHKATLASLRAAHPILPRYVKYAPPYMHGLWRAAGHGTWDPTARLAERVLVSAVKLMAPNDRAA
jgi:uncharacterized protein (DUF2236 family)